MAEVDVAYLCDWGFVGGRLVPDVRVDVDGDGTIVGLTHGGESTSPLPIKRRRFGPSMLLPGLVNAHSHAFQRGIRGQTHRRGTADPSSFWSWRTAMYAAAEKLDPDSLYEVTTVAFSEMLRAGITSVGEFHYVHHQPGGVPYDDPNELSWRVVQAARDVGLRLTLLDVFYARGGPGTPALPEQRRFCDASVDAYLRRIDDLRSAGVAVGITPHSIRAVELPQLRELAAYAAKHNLPIHTHLSEQPAENAASLEEHGMSPAAAFASCGALDRPRAFTAVHATHIDDADRALLATQNVCVCPTTEADLGDGILDAPALRAAGCNLSLGSDSNAVIDLVQEARLLEMHDRLASQARLRLNDSDGSLGPALLQHASAGGALSLGRADAGALEIGSPFDAVVIDLQHPFFGLIPPGQSLDALLTAGTAGCVQQVLVGGTERL